MFTRNSMCLPSSRTNAWHERARTFTGVSDKSRFEMNSVFVELTGNFNCGRLTLRLAPRGPCVAFAFEWGLAEVLVHQIFRNCRRHFLQLDTGVWIDM